MRRKTVICLLAMLFLVSGYTLLCAQGSESEDASMGLDSQSAPATTESQQAPIATGPQVQWLWGEVVSVDTDAKQIKVKYLDYETDTEKEINIVVDDKTTYENVASLGQIKVGDTLSSDYLVKDTENIARNISVETNTGVSSDELEGDQKETMPTPGLE